MADGLDNPALVRGQIVRYVGPPTEVLEVGIRGVVLTVGDHDVFVDWPTLGVGAMDANSVEVLPGEFEDLPPAGPVKRRG